MTLICLEKQSNLYFIDIDVCLDTPLKDKFYLTELPLVTWRVIKSGSVYTRGIITPFKKYGPEGPYRFELLMMDGDPGLIKCGEPLLGFDEIPKTDLPLYMNWKFKSPNFMRG